MKAINVGLLGIGTVGWIVQLDMPVIGGAHTAWAVTGLVGLRLRGVVAGI